MPQPDFEAANRARYGDREQVDWYATRSGLHPAEQVLFDRYVGTLQGARVLDLGVGGGRTVPALAALATVYVGVDYAPELIEAARQRFPDQRIECHDARDLAEFGEDQFDVVVFSFNGLDYVSHAGRLAVLAEVRRVLVPGGLFLFSSHNRGYERIGRLPWQRPRRWGRSLVRESAHALLRTRTRLRMRRLTLVGADHALVNDDAHGYSLLTYYVSSEDQVRQLEVAGFASVEVFDQLGAPAAARQPGSRWLYYAALNG